MQAVVVPFHQDERLGTDSLPMPPGVAVSLVAPDLPEADQWQRLHGLYDATAGEVAAAIRATGTATTVSGDCLALLGTLAGAQRAGLDPGVVWFDAHGDVHTVDSSASGYPGGLALLMAMGGDAELLAGPLGLRPVAEERVVLVGARDLDPPEVTYLASAPVRRHTVQDVQASDLPDVPIVLHIDVDVIDSAEVPGLRFPVSDGPSMASVVAAVRRLVEGGRVRILDIACPWFDARDRDQQDVRRDVLAGLLACSP